MNFLVFLFLIPLFFIGITVAYFDFKKGVIPNKIIFAGFLYGVILYLGVFFINFFYLQSENLSFYLLQAFLNGVFSILVGYLIWKINFWSAGDGKLFGLYGFLLPLEFYSGFYINYFPAFALLVNLFIPLICWIFLQAVIYVFKKRKSIKNFVKEKDLLKLRNLKNWGKKIMYFITSITLAMIIIRLLFVFFEKIFKITPNGFVIFLLLFSTIYGLDLLKKKNYLVEFVKYFVIFVFFGTILAKGDFNQFFSLLKTIAFFAIFIGFLKSFLMLYIRKGETEEIRAVEAKEGMVLTKEWKRYLSEKISKMTKRGKDKHFKDMKAEGLTKEQAKIIRELFSDDKKYKIEVCNTLPFALFMFFSAGFSVITYTNLIPFVVEFFNFFIYF